MVVQHNLSAMNANRYLGINNSKLSKSLEKLSSGYAINRAGDNAAGLAVSEKMRSQIAGMTQAVKNAQDGISMVQTFEGALTETDSILQRMKTLADQMANGTYDDPVDRTAAQQEFLQLNDELDQIADTDFNGVIVLNGGRMSDGLQEVNGAFDYANKDAQLAAEKADALAKLNAEKATLAASTPKDIFKTADIWNTLDDSGYQADEAAKLWEDLGLDADKVASIEVTYTAKVADDGTVSYEATSGKTADGTALTADQLKELAATAVNGDADTTGKGGFTVSAGGTDNVNAIFDATKIKDGDVLTLTFTGPGSSAKAPTNAGIANDSIKVTGGVDADETHYSVTIGALTDDDMTADVKTALDALNGKEIKFTITNGTKAPAALTGIEVGGTALAANGIDATNKLFYAIDTNGKLTVSTLNAAGTGAGKTIMEVDLSGADNATAAGTLTFTLALDSYSVPGATTVDAEPKATDLGAEIAANQAKIDAIDAKIKELDEKGVSVSDAFNKSEGKMTYKKSIILQAGARTKDAVEFTFNYKSDAIGDLAADLNCTAKGLGTKDLNLSTQEAANEAIDKIDQAINKVSLVRGTFGAIQNRLEHKIDNLNVSVENLTSAESQIRDTNMPQEMMNFTKQQILAQASQSMLAQANQLPQGVLSLLQ